MDKYSEDKVSLDLKIQNLYNELLSSNKDASNQKLYKKYFKLPDNSKNVTKIEYNEFQIEKEYNDLEYFALISSERMDALDALNIYRTKDIIEKGFGNLKEKLNMRRLLGIQTYSSSIALIASLAFVYGRDKFF